MAKIKAKHPSSLNLTRRECHILTLCIEYVERECDDRDLIGHVAEAEFLGLKAKIMTLHGYQSPLFKKSRAASAGK
jgi:hypothetical protein